MLATHGFVPLAAGTPSAQTHPATRPAGPGTVDPAAPVGVDPPVAAVNRWAGAIWHEVEEKRRLPRLSKGTRQTARGFRATYPQGSVVRVFTVSVKYSGQPEQDAGDYPTREQAAHAAALAAGIVGEHGTPPVKVGIHESHSERLQHRAS